MNAAPRLLLATPEAIVEAADLLRRGHLVAFPTETVYGLGADATNDRAVAAVFAAKGRPSFNPLIVHVAGIDAADALAEVDQDARRLMETFWPGPLTLVLKRRARAPLSLLVSAGLETVALRMPNHGVARALIAAGGRPIAAPSANRSGHVSPTTAAHVAQDFGADVAVILDDGPCRVGIESTVVDLAGPAPALLRLGGLPVETIERLTGPLDRPRPGAPRSPGLIGRHYAPRRPLRCYAAGALPGEALLAFGPGMTGATLNLSPSANLQEAAANLFAMLRRLDVPPYTGIAVTPIPEIGLGRAINDRLRRAAAWQDQNDWCDERGPAAPCVLPDDEAQDDGGKGPE